MREGVAGADERAGDTKPEGGIARRGVLVDAIEVVMEETDEMEDGDGGTAPARGRDDCAASPKLSVTLLRAFFIGEPSRGVCSLLCPRSTVNVSRDMFHE